MEIKKNILILIDEDESTAKMAERICLVLKDKPVRLLAASNFTGADILSADVCFFGCHEPRPSSFIQIEEVLQHINLAGRSCGIFSPKSWEAVQYLSSIVADSEITLFSKPLFADKDNGNQYIHNWVHDALNQSAITEKINLDDYIRKVPDFPKKGVLFYDITSILANPRAFRYCIDEMVVMYRDKQIDAVAAIEARGFLFAAPFAERMKIPLILIRKKGKLPGKTIAKKYQLEYAEAEVEIHPDDVPAGKQVLLMDDLIATGGTLSAARELIVASGATVPEIFGIVGLPFLHYEKNLEDIPIRTLITYQSE